MAEVWHLQPELPQGAREFPDFSHPSHPNLAMTPFSLLSTILAQGPPPQPNTVRLGGLAGHPSLTSHHYLDQASVVPVRYLENNNCLKAGSIPAVCFF